MKPPKPDKTEYEKVSTDDFLTGVIKEVQYDQEHKFKGFNGEADKLKSAVRFKFEIDGYKHSHYSRWMTFSYGEKSNLFLKYLVPLVDGAVPDMDFDLDQLKGLKVKTLWSEKNDFQTVETIRPIGGKIAFTAEQVVQDEFDPSDLQPDEDVPF